MICSGGAGLADDATTAVTVCVSSVSESVRSDITTALLIVMTIVATTSSADCILMLEPGYYEYQSSLH